MPAAQSWTECRSCSTVRGAVLDRGSPLLHGPIAIVLSVNLFRVGVTGSSETVLVTMPLCLAASLVGGWAFYRWVEVRFHNPPLPAPSPVPPASRPTESEASPHSAPIARALVSFTSLAPPCSRC